MTEPEKEYEESRRRELLDKLATRFRKRVTFCQELEVIAVQETRWHDAATMKSHSMIWARAARMIEEEL